MLIGSCITGSQPKRVFHVHHSVAIFADKRYDLSHKSIVVYPKSETVAQKRKIWQLKRKSVKRAFKAYTLRPKRKSKQVWEWYISTIYIIVELYHSGHKPSISQLSLLGQLPARADDSVPPKCCQKSFLLTGGTLYNLVHFHSHCQLFSSPCSTVEREML